MAYTLNHTNSNLTPIVVPDGQIDTSTSLKFVGKTVQNYGGIIDQNFLNLMENFSSSVAPGSTTNVVGQAPKGQPVTGQIWHDSANDDLKYYNGVGFKKIGGAIASSAEPRNVKEGDLWLDNNITGNPLLKMRSNNQWVTVGPAGAQATVTGELILDNHLQTHAAITFNIDGLRYAILSNDEVVYRTRQSATDSSPIPGFYTIGPGLNIADTGQVLGNRFWGTATGAEKILLPQPPGLGDVYLTAHDFIRANVPGFTSGSLTVKSNTGLTLGANNQIIMSFTNLDFNINNVSSNGNTRFSTKDAGGTTHNILSLFGNGNATFGGDLNLIGALRTNQITTGTINLTGNIPSTNPDTGTLIMLGGLGLTGSVHSNGSARFAGNVNIFGGGLSIGYNSTDATAGRGSLNINGTTESIMWYRVNETAKGLLQATSSGFYMRGVASPVYVLTNDVNPIVFQTNLTTRMVIDGVGNVGVATTDTNTYKMNVNGTFNANGNISEAGHPTLNSANYNNYVPSLSGTGAYGTWDISITGGVGGTAAHATEAYLLNLNNEGTKKIKYNGWASTNPGYQYSGSGSSIFGFSADSGVVDVYSDGDFYANTVNKVLNAGNYNTYAPTLTGTGASGTWGIDITGTAANAARAAGLVSTNDYTVQNMAVNGSLSAAGAVNFSSTLGVGSNITAGGYISAVGDIYAFNTSDRNLKTKIKPIRNALDKVCDISGNTFEWTKEHLETRPENYRQASDVGVIAQEVAEVLPEAVITRSDGTMAVDYTKIVPLLVEAIKELRAELADIKKPSLLDKLKGKK